MTVFALRPRLLRLLLPLLVLVFTAISGNALAGPKPAPGQFLTAATLIGAEPLQDATLHQAVWKITPKPAAGCCVAAETAASALPSTLARVIPNGIPAVNLGAPGAADVFVTTPEAIEGLDAAGIAQRLTIPESPTGFQIIQFPTPEVGLASPVFRTNPGFVGGGFTAGGAPEFVIPNGPIPSGATITTVP